ncbi:TonB-dependent receptor domain-containing protein [Altererythrobacter sp.]|uniref:TonB-dependent receptor domain-containing protein n=1 Tax=Altererythrobacter sp. TaxID=1872480 RepID=UPI003D106C1C
MKISGTGWRASVATMALGLSLAQTNQVKAQDAKGEEAETESIAPEAEEEYSTIVVTGSNISGVKQVGSETVVLDREQVLATGKSTVAEVLRTLPQVQNASANSFTSTVSGGNSQGGSNVTRGNSVNLRGVGQGATLTLVNGHRITPTGTATAFSEANQVPIAAIERIEVIADSASAIYGSDAIAGVINYVLRKDFEGIELGGSYTFGDYGNDEWTLSGVVGTHWSTSFGDGNIIATFEYLRREPYLRGRNQRLRADQRPFGGNDDRVNGNVATAGLAGNIYIPTADGLTNPNFPQGGANTYYVLPDNPTGNILTIDDLQEVQLSGCMGAATPSCASYPSLVDRSDFEDFQGSLRRKQATILFHQDIGEIEFYDEFFWTRSEQFTRTFASGNQATNPTVQVQPGSPYYLDLPNATRSPFPPFVPSFPQPLDVQFNLLARMPDGAPRFGNQNPDESFNNTFGARAPVFANWRAEAYYTFGKNKTCGVCYLGNYITLERTNLAGISAASALQQLIDLPVDDPLHLNPFSTAPFTEEQLDYILGTNSQYAQNWSHDFVAKLDGKLFELPAGDVRAAFGGEYYYGIQKLQNAANRPPDPGPVTTPDANARTTREQYAAFGEVYLPLVSQDMDVPLVQELTLSAALRYDHYSDFGSTTNQKISATWDVTEDFSLRGSWGTSFRAPGLPELNAGVFSVGLGSNIMPGPGITGFSTQPNGSMNVLFIFGNNPNLKPEEGTNWQIGGNFTPSSVPGLRLSATYYNLHYKNKLGTAGVPAPIFAPGPFASPELLAQYSAYVIPVNNTPDGMGGCMVDPAIEEFTGFLYGANLGANPRDFCNLNAVVDGRTISAANTFQDGIDASINYYTDTNIGTFSFNVSVNKILTNEERTVENAPMISALDTIGDPISWRGRGSVSFQNGPFSATLFGNYIGSYLNDQPITLRETGEQLPQARVPSWTTFDLNLSYTLPRGADRWSFSDGIRFSVTVSNLFDNDPPIVLSTLTGGSSSIDLIAHNAFGRSVQVSLTKSF